MQIQKIPYNKELEKISFLLPNGAFLILQSDNITNIMTINWCLIGYMWNRPIIQILIRTSRYSYSLIEKTDNFTVNFPIHKNMNNELFLCGTKSGRDCNKIKECNFILLPSQKVKTPIIANCGLYYECRILTKQKLPVEKFEGDESHENNMDGHFHIMYYGEIVSCYKVKDGT